MKKHQVELDETQRKQLESMLGGSSRDRPMIWFWSLS